MMMSAVGAIAHMHDLARGGESGSDDDHDHDHDDQDDGSSSSSDNEDASSSSSSEKAKKRDLEIEKIMRVITGRDFTEHEIVSEGHYWYLEVRKRFEAKGYRINVDAKGHKQVVLLPSQRTLQSYLLRTARRKDPNDHSARREGHFELEPDPILIWSFKEFPNVVENVQYMYALLPQNELKAKPFIKEWLQDPTAATINGLVFDPSLPSGLVNTRDSLSGKRLMVWNRWHGWAARYLPDFDERLKRLIKHELAKLEEEEATQQSDKEEEDGERAPPVRELALDQRYCQ